MSFIYQPKNSKSYYIGYKDRNGRWVQRSTRMRYKEAAKKYLERVEKAVAEGKPDLPSPISLRDFLAGYLETQRRAVDPGTHERYGYCFQSLVKDGSPLAGLCVSDVTIGTCSQYVSWRLTNGKSKATANKEMGWLKATLAEAARQQLISMETLAWIREEINPKRLPALRKANRSRERVLLPKEIPILFEAAAQNRNLHDALQVALWTGLRQKNILELTEAQVDFTCEPAVIRFGPGQMKNKAGHLVKLAPKAREILWSRLVVDPAKTGRHFFQDFRPAWKRVQRQLEREVQCLGCQHRWVPTKQRQRCPGCMTERHTPDPRLPDFHFHDLRRTYTTYRLAAGIDPKTVQDEVGHQDSRMTMDCYGKAVRDPGVKAWAMQTFRFPWDPHPFCDIAETHPQAPRSLPANSP